jgi:hypothetical protein
MHKNPSPRNHRLTGLQEFKESGDNPYDEVHWSWIPLGIIVGTVLGLVVGWIMLGLTNL